MKDEVTFGQRIRELRLEKNLSQRDLADQVAKRLRDEERRGFNFTYLSKIENGKMPPPSEAAIRQLAAVLSADLDELLALAGKPPVDLSNTLSNSPGARAFFRSAMARDLSEEEWQQLLKSLKKEKPK